MQKIVGIKIGDRIEEAEKVQNLLTEYGSVIKTRLGIRGEDSESDKGTIIIEIDEKNSGKTDELENKLSQLESIEIREMQF